MHRILPILGGCVMVLYPFLVWRGLTVGSPRWVALVMVLVLLPMAWVRWRSLQKRSEAAGVEGPAANFRGLAVIPLVSVTSLVSASILDSLGLILVVPVFANVVLMIVFGSTLRRGSIPMVERFARLQLGEPTPEQAAWCRMWTWLWSAFFVVNGGLAALTALFGSLDTWAFYNGFLAYILIGSMFAAEWSLRRIRFPESRNMGKNPPPLAPNADGSDGNP